MLYDNKVAIRTLPSLKYILQNHSILFLDVKCKFFNLKQIVSTLNVKTALLAHFSLQQFLAFFYIDRQWVQGIPKIGNL